MPVEPDPLLEPAQQSEIASLPMASNEPISAAEPDLDLPWVTAYLADDAEPAPASPTQLHSLPVAADVPTSLPDVS